MGSQVLVATLGSEPHVVTLVLDLLRAKGYFIAEVVVMHTVGETVRPALERLAEEFALPGVYGYRRVLVESGDRPVADIVTEADRAAFLGSKLQVVRMVPNCA